MAARGTFLVAAYRDFLMAVDKALPGSHCPRGARLHQVESQSALWLLIACGPPAQLFRVQQVLRHAHQPLQASGDTKDPREPGLDVCPRTGELRRDLRGVGGPRCGVCHYKTRPGPS